jgi:hypothetical protein
VEAIKKALEIQGGKLFCVTVGVIIFEIPIKMPAIRPLLDTMIDAYKMRKIALITIRSEL